jgi:tetratricopeptide (TPR) repeat protein
MNGTRIAALVALALTTATLHCSAASNDAPSAALGSVAPALSARTLMGRNVSVASYAGKVLVLNFWATWCPPCRAETGDLVSAYKSLHAPGVAFLGIDTTETAPVVRTFLSAHGVPYETALAGPQAYNHYGVSYIPTTVVIDAKGVVRARWTGGVTPDQLAQYVDGAKLGRSVSYLPPAQKNIDEMLDPAQFAWNGDIATMRGSIAGAQKRVEEVDAYVSNLPPTTGIPYDDERTQREEGALLEAAGHAQRTIADSNDDKLRADALLAAAYGDLNRFDEAAQAYRDALTMRPNDPKLVFGLSRTYYRLHDYAAMAQAAREYIALQPDDPDGYDELGLAYQRSRRFADAVGPYEKCLALLIAREKAAHGSAKGDAAGVVADEALDLGDVYVSLGDKSGAKRTFDLAQRYALLIPPKSQLAGLRERVPERTAEGMAAVGLTQSTHTTLALSRWTGPDLPGSIKSTYKYRLIVVAPPSKPVTLTAQGVRPGWVASFCADGLCSPKTVSFVAPAAGVKTYEFQLVPPTDRASPGRVSVHAGAARADLP